MPDIAGRPHTKPQGTLDWVGMSDIHQPILVRTGNANQRVQARVQVYVDLNDPHAKGIHMSRLYLLLDEHARTRPLSIAGLKMLLGSMHSSHLDLSSSAFVQFDFEYELRQMALLSDNAGWSSYPVTVKGTLANGKMTLELGVEILYSSTCPCSAALARQLIQKAFADRFDSDRPIDFADVNEWLGTEQGIVATPHSQRSVAKVITQLADDVNDLPIATLIDTLETAIGTPVQAAVKRQDEQEFALRNGQNLMFCEDAARKLQTALNDDPSYSDFWLRIEHHESLHAHDAVSIVTKGIDGGYLPIP
ncbi:MAG: GTP cyclohydrolase I FolE2 [Pseudomonadales bacterium]|nr:GTP cyclohydrolase I FolE2 [Pseudomonadales bacterium]NIX08733.1 GTP cyclohydrolase I FolE2 [Pseudomonadales bacterium]